jgi:hypothetical protein
MQSTLLLAGLVVLGAGLSLVLYRFLRSRQNHCTGRMPIELDFDAAKLREQNRQ